MATPHTLCSQISCGIRTVKKLGGGEGMRDRS
jgi:hypothetical protein